MWSLSFSPIFASVCFYIWLTFAKEVSPEVFRSLPRFLMLPNLVIFILFFAGPQSYLQNHAESLACATILKTRFGQILTLLKDIAPSSVAEPVHFCPAPAPAPAFQKFRLRLGQFTPYN
jgi:hypothetical protein